MIVYRSQQYTVETAKVVAEVASFVAGTPTDGGLQDALIRLGELEAGVVDAWTAGGSGEPPESRVFRDAAVRLGRLFYRSRRDLDTASATAAFRAAFAAVQALELPRAIHISVAEGYAFYGLYPETYIGAAECFMAERRPSSACVIGIRSIGTSLSAVVAGTLEELGCTAYSMTVRPQGHPFDRKLDPAPDFPLEAPFFLIVDEGPGLSGSSFLSVADALDAAGVSTERVVLLPSWEGDAARFVNERVQARWPLYRKYCAAPGVEPAFNPPARDLSAGRWRDLPGAPQDVAVQPQHEARKYLAGSRLYKFSGLSHYGRAKFDESRLLAEAGYAPRAHSLDNGFVAFDWIPRASKSTSPEPEHIARYLDFRRRHFPAERSASFDQFLEMIAINTPDAMAERLIPYRTEFEDRPAVAVDGRMLPYEWIPTRGGWLKADAVDHCRNHFFPGYADIAWDLAGASIEGQLAPEQRERLFRSYRAASNDRLSPGLLSFYETAYRAFRFGYVIMAAEATSGSPDAERFRALGRVYAQPVLTTTA